MKDGSNIGDIKSNMEKLNASWAAIASKMQSTEIVIKVKSKKTKVKTSSEKKIKTITLKMQILKL